MKVIGLDIGGSNIRGVLWNGAKILRSFEVSTPNNPNKFKNVLKSEFKNLNTRGEVKKIGIGVAGKISGTKVIRATNIPYFKNFDFKKVFPKLLVRVDNDARTYARAEYNIGSGKDFKSMLVITLGTGIGRAYGENKKIKKLKLFETNESWEKEFQKIHVKKTLAKFLGKRLLLIIRVINPEIIVIGGGVVEKKGYFESIKEELRSVISKLEIRRSKLGKFAGAIGAAMLFSTPH